ncbi:MAG: helix-turn-helix transcriptional regulator [Alphaproteobacteria bacterium]
MGVILIGSRDGVRKRRAGAEDVEIGRKIRALRLERGLSQSGLAEGIGLTFQQVQKYEKGANRVSAGRLQQISDMLNVPVTFFYSGMGARAKKGDGPPSSLAFLQTKGALRLMRAYTEISSRATKYALVVLAESLRNRESKEKG